MRPHIFLLLTTLLIAFGCQNTDTNYIVTDQSHHPSLPLLNQMKVVEEIVCAESIDLFESPDKLKVEEFLGKKALVLSPKKEGSNFLYLRLGKNSKLEAGKPYILEIEYPDDKARNFVVQNRGAEYGRGLYTGQSLGDALNPLYVQSNPESLSIPHSHKYQHWRTLFWLHDRYVGLEMPRDKGERTETPNDGFLVIVSQFGKDNSPLNNGIAISKIKLYEAPEYATFKLDINYPPNNLPRRHTFFREEMSDGVINSEIPGVTEPTSWYEYKAKLMGILGMNTYSKDLLEFGHNQGWETLEYGWMYQPKWKKRWEEIVNMVSDYDLYVLPYYEYSGSIGPKGLGKKRRAVPLSEENDGRYTQIKWSEKANIDVTDPEAITDLQKVFTKTILRHKDKVPFVGAWIRTRASQIPISFAKSTLQRYNEEKNTLISREHLSKDDVLYNNYLEWWYGKRREFLQKMQEFLEQNEISDKPVLLFTADHTEAGKTHIDWGYKNHIVTDDKAKWRRAKNPVHLLHEIVDQNWHQQALLKPENTWGSWEWHHSIPPPDPSNFKNDDGVLMTYTFNKAYTVGSDSTFEPFKNQSGLAIIRHYCLNENSMEDMGYFVADMDREGPYTMLAEAKAVAFGDPTYIGYLSSASFNRSSIEYVRDFNANFLCLPGIIGEVKNGWTDDEEIIVREYSVSDQNKFLAIVNTSLMDKPNTIIKLEGNYDVIDAANGEYMYTNTNNLTLDMYPSQLKSIQLVPVSGKQKSTLEVDYIPLQQVGSEFKVNFVSNRNEVTFKVANGPAIINQNGVCSLDESGWVKLQLSIPENDSYLPIKKTVTFRVE